MRNVMMHEEPDGNVVGGSVTYAEPAQGGGLTVWYGYEYRGQSYSGRLDFRGSGRPSSWVEQCDSAAATGGQRNPSQSCELVLLGPTNSGRVVLDGWWKGPRPTGKKAARLSWTLSFDVSPAGAANRNG